MTNDLTGRALDEAAARSMGWTNHSVDHGAPTEREMLAWLHERGEVEIYSNARGASAALWLPDINRGTDDCKVGGTSPAARGSNLTEALQRLVVAVAKRGSKSKETP